MAKETLTEKVAEYNKLTGKNIKSFTDHKSADRRLKNARILATSDKHLVKAGASVKKTPAAKKKGTKKVAIKKTVGLKVQVGSKKYSSVTVAFKELKIASGSLGILRRVRKELNTNGEAMIEGYKFRMVK